MSVIAPITKLFYFFSFQYPLHKSYKCLYGYPHVLVNCHLWYESFYFSCLNHFQTFWTRSYFNYPAQTSRSVLLQYAFLCCCLFFVRDISAIICHLSNRNQYTFTHTHTYVHSFLLCPLERNKNIQNYKNQIAFKRELRLTLSMCDHKSS